MERREAQKWTQCSFSWYRLSKICIAISAAFLAATLNNLLFEDATKNYFISKILLGTLATLTFTVSLLCYDISRFNPASSHRLSSLLQQYLISRLGVFMGPPSLKKFIKGMGNVKEQQNKILLEILRSNSDTIYGKDFGFKNMKSYNDYKARQPVIKYDHFKSYVDMITEHGTQNVLTKSNVVFLSPTSGTTGKAKLIPVCDSDMSRMIPLFFLTTGTMLNKGLPVDICKQMRMWFTPNVRDTPGGLKIGRAVHFVYQKAKNSLTMLPSNPAIFDITKEDAAFNAQAVFALREKEIGKVDFFFASQLLDFWKFVVKNIENICNDIRSGKLSETLDLPTEVRNKLSSDLKPDQKRADEILAEVRKGTDGLAKRLWPYLSSCPTIVTGSMEVYARRLKQTFMKGVPMFTAFHVGTEGFYGINISPDIDNHTYALAYDAQFFEFIHESDCNEENPPTLLAHELTVGESYEIVLTKMSGLYRYRVGDIIKIVRYEQQCPVYEFKYRLGHTINVFWEKTPEDVLQRSVLLAADALGVALVDFTTTEDINFYDTETGNSIRHYVLFIEIEDTQKLAHKQLAKFDEHLCKEAEIYKELRGKNSLGLMDVKQLASGSFRELAREMNKEAHSTQFKMPRVMRNKQYLDFLANRIM